jgi:gliding motility-associated-like protein
MRTALQRTKLSVLFILFFIVGHAQLNITTSTNAQALAQYLVGDGISISNVTLTGSPLASGFFKHLGGTQIGLDSGIVLSSGRVATSGTDEGLNGLQSSLASSSFSTPGDPQLQALVNNETTNDAAILEFDFVPLGDTVKFRYVFSSDEYPTFTCSIFNDVFAFFISGPGFSGPTNMALIPGTTIPVAINSINNASSGASNISVCNAMGPGSPFSQYYINNTGNTYLTHNGHTTVLTAIAIVQPCQTYHLKIAIADVRDRSWDSGVFIEAKSLVSSPLKIINQNPVANGVPYIVEGCTSGSIQISRIRKQTYPQTVNLIFAGTAQNGTDVQAIPVSVTIPANDSIINVPIYPIPDNFIEGNELLKIYITYGGCAAGTYYTDSISINVKDQVTATTNIQPSSCTANTGNITVLVPPGSGTEPYYYALNGGNFQTSNQFGSLSSSSYVVSVKDSTGCVYNFTNVVGLNNIASVVALPSDTTICQGASFTPRVQSNGTVFSWTPTSAVGSPDVLQPALSPAANTRYIVTATLGQCSTTDTLNVTVFQSIPVNAGPDLTIISGDMVQLQATGSTGSTYVWTPATGLSAANVLRPNASPTATTTYTLRQTTAQGCISQDEMTVTVLSCVDPMVAFTPNGDGINDRWLVTNSQCLKSAKVEVFNRYGNKVFEDANYSNQWDGNYKGKPLPDGTYYYVVTYTLVNGKPTYIKGNVTILR